MQKLNERPAMVPPLCYSFKDLRSIEDILYESPSSGVTKSAPLRRTKDTDGSMALATTASEEPPPGARGCPNSMVLKLSNNSLTSLRGLHEVAEKILNDPADLVWLDVSCNKLTSVDGILSKFPGLQVLYLHGNEIGRLSDVRKLSSLTNLQKLTLHGNPVNELPHYRDHVVGHVPTLRSLDFSAITRVDRDNIDTWMRGHMKRKADR